MCFVRWCTNLFIYLFTFCCYWCFFFTFFFFFPPEFAFPWCMMDGQHSSCCSNWHIWSLRLTFSFFPRQPSLAQNEFCFLLNGSCESSLSLFFFFFFDLLCRRVVSEQFRNDYWSSWKMHDWHFLVSLSHEIFPDTFYFYFFLIAHALSVAWLTKICFLTLVKIDRCCFYFLFFGFYLQCLSV